MAPMYRNFTINPSEEKSIENKINKTIDTIICINKSENKFLNQALQNQLLEFKHKDKIAKGVRRAKTFIIIYLKEYEKTKLRREKVNVDFIKPSIEKILVVIVLIPI